MKPTTQKKCRRAAGVCLAISIGLAFFALPSKPSPEAVELAEAELAEWQARHHEDITHGRVSSAGPRPEGVPKSQISPLLVLASFVVCMIGVALFFMTFV
jgi:hypothetical protein